MKASARVVAVVLGALGLAGAGWLYTMAQSIDTSRLEHAVELLQELQQLDGRWSVEVLQVSANPQADFDGLAGLSTEVSRGSRELRDTARKELDIPGDLKAALLSYTSRLDSKEERIERFKSAYAIVRNSQRYLPLAGQIVSARTAEYRQDDLGRTIVARQDEINNYFANPTELEKQRIMLSLESLKTSRPQYPEELGSALGNFLAHALVLLEKKAALDELRSAATSLDAVDIASSLAAELTSLISSREATRVRYERVSFGLAFVVLAGLATFFAFAYRVAPASAVSRPVRAVDSSESTLDLSSPALELYDERDHEDDAPAPTGPVNASDRNRQEYLLQVTRAGARRLDSHMGLMSEVYAELASSLAGAHSSPDATNDRAAQTASSEASTRLESLANLVQRKTVPKLLQAMRRCVQTVDRASAEFHADMRPLVETEKQPFEVAECVENALMLFGPRGTDITIEKNLAAVGAVAGSSTEMTAALGCVITNSVEELEAAERPGVIRVQVAEENGACLITVADDGRGMDQQTRKSALAAFFSIKDGHRGLGLSTALYIVKKHGGRVLLNSVAGKGTAVRFVLPIDGKPLHDD